MYCKKQLQRKSLANMFGTCEYVFPCSKGRKLQSPWTLGLFDFHIGLYQCAKPFFLAMITSLGVSISPRHFPFLWTKDHPAFLRNLHRPIPFVLGGKPRKRLSGESLRAQWKAWKLNKVEWLRCHFEPSLEPKKKRGFKFKLQVFWICLEKISWKKLMDFFLGCFLNIWEKTKMEGGEQCFGEKISSFHRRRDCTIAALKSEKAVSGTQQKIDVAHPQSLTWNLKMMVSIRNPLFQGSNLTWNLKMNPWKKEIPIGNHHFYPRKLTAGTWKMPP